MIIYAIDPGPKQSGWCMYVPESGDVRDAGVADNHDVLRWLEHDECSSELAIETMQANYAAVGDSVISTLVWIGRFQQRWLDAHHHERPVRLISRQSIKAAVCNGNTKATDSGVRQALIDKLGPPGTKRAPGPTYGVTSHAWAALAVAVARGMEAAA